MTRTRLAAVLVPVAVVLAACGGDSASTRPAVDEWASLRSGFAAFEETRQAGIDAFGTPSPGSKGSWTIGGYADDSLADDSLEVIKRSWEAQGLEYAVVAEHVERIRGEVLWAGTYFVASREGYPDRNLLPGVSTFGAQRFGVSGTGERVDFWSSEAVEQGISLILETQCFKEDGVGEDWTVRDWRVLNW